MENVSDQLLGQSVLQNRSNGYEKSLPYGCYENSLIGEYARMLLLLVAIPLLVVGAARKQSTYVADVVDRRGRFVGVTGHETRQRLVSSDSACCDDIQCVFCRHQSERSLDWH